MLVLTTILSISIVINVILFYAWKRSEKWLDEWEESWRKEHYEDDYMFDWDEEEVIN